MKPTPITSLPMAVAERTRERIAKLARPSAAGCWVWGGRLDRYGYGAFRLTLDGRKRDTGAHRAAWLAHRGDIPDGLQIDHLCRNRACCNPSHLDLVTNQENVLRAVAAAGPGRRGRPRYPECVHGHPLSGENLHLYVRPDGYTIRVCIACRRRRGREHKARRASA